MLGPVDFKACVLEQLTAKGFGEKRRKELLDNVEGLAKHFRETNDGPAAWQKAIDSVIKELEYRNRTKQRLAYSNLSKLADAKERFRKNAAMSPARVAISFLEHDPRIAGLSYATEKENVRGQLYAIMGDVLDRMGKGAFGSQRGKAHFPNVVRELFGETTGDKLAGDFAIAWRKTTDAAVDLFNAAGGALKKRKDWNLPQSMNAAKLVRAGFDDWAEFHRTNLAWDRMRWPDGSPIKSSEREDVLRNIYDTLKTGGAIKIDPGKFNGRGSAVGDALDNHRFMVYRDADAWLQMHGRYGDGSVFDVMVNHLESTAHKVALVQTFGSNPAHMKDTIRALALKQAAKKDAAAKDPSKKRTATSKAEASLKNTFEPMWELATRDNPMDPDSLSGNLITSIGNILTSAQLGSASLLAIPGDFVTTVATRMANKMGSFEGIGMYVRALATDRAYQRSISTQSGFVFDEVVSAVYSAHRFTGLGTYGPAITKRVSETVMRASLLSGHTKAARWASQSEFMGLLARNVDTAFEELPFAEMMGRYGIDAAQWDAFRKNVQPWSPRSGVTFLRPIDLLKLELADKSDLYRRFQGMIFEESRRMVPESTLEAAAMLKGSTRPDTLVGALMHSFAMYKNFPVSMMMIYGRLAMTLPTNTGRLAFVSGLATGMTLVGALGTQMREISRGRDPLPMDSPSFWGKALLSGGALSIWGDFLFQGVNDFGRGPQDVAAGPVVGFAGDTMQLLAGDVFKWVDAVGSLEQQDFEATLPQRAVQYIKRYTPGTNLWWARLAFERFAFDALEDLADPRASQKRRARIKRQRKDFGNEYFSPPGSRGIERLPQLQGR